MPLKNYTTRVPASQSVQEIQEMLQKHGATGVLLEYEQGTGRIASLSFKINVHDRDWGFRLPLKWREAQRVMIEQGVRRAGSDEDYVYRVAWRILRDWVAVQMALVEIEMVALQEVFLPYAIHPDGKTLYEHVVSDPSHMLN
jgi:hypothetical protein